jgi:hypothetical protein
MIFYDFYVILYFGFVYIFNIFLIFNIFWIIFDHFGMFGIICKNIF